MTMVKTYCGLARLALAKDDLNEAMNQVEAGLDMVEELLPKVGDLRVKISKPIEVG